MAKKKSDSSVLHLFSSDSRTLYLQDCFEILALPGGAVHRFRYDKSWLELGTEAEARDSTWLELAKRKQRVLVHFVAASSKRYGERVLVPLRWGRVVGAFVEGDAYFVDFEVGGYADPTAFSAQHGDRVHLESTLVKQPADETADFSARRDTAVQVTKSIESLLKGMNPPEYFAVLGDAPQDSGEFKSESTASFARIARIMQDLVGLRQQREKYQGDAASFFRVVSIVSIPNRKEVVFKNGVLTLRRGLTYELRTFHLNTSNGGQADVLLGLPASINPVSPSSVGVVGKYDVRDFGFSPKAEESDAVGEITLSSTTIHEVDEDPSARYHTAIHLPVLSVPRKTFVFLNWGIAVATGVAAFALALNALSSIATTPLKDLAGYIDLSWFVAWINPTAFLAVATGGILPAAFTAVAAFGVALAALFRRRWGLSPA